MPREVNLAKRGQQQRKGTFKFIKIHQIYQMWDLNFLLSVNMHNIYNLSKNNFI